MIRFLVGALLCGVLIASPAPAQAAAPSLVISTAVSVPGEFVRFYGALSPRQARPIVVQRRTKTSARWLTIASVNSSQLGAYAATVRSPVVGSYYVRTVAPRIVVRGKVFPALVSATKAFSVIAQAAGIAIPATLMSGQPGTASVVFRPIRPGRAVALQVLRANKWTNLAVGRESAKGAASFALAAGAAGTYYYRAYAAASNGAAAVVSPWKRLVVTPSAVTIAPVAEPLTPAEQSSLTSYTPVTGAVTFTGPPLTGVSIGDVLVSGPTTTAPDGLLRRVQSLSSSGGRTTYATQPATLAQVITNVPDALSSVPLDVVAEQITAVDSGVTINPASGTPARKAPRTFTPSDGVAAIDAPTINFTIGFSQDVTIPGSNQKVTFAMSGPMTVTPRAVFQFDADWGQVRRVEMRAGFGTTSNLTWSVSTPAGASLTKPLSYHRSLMTVERWYGAFIGPVPVAVRVKLELVADINVSGKLSLSWKTTTNGELTAGLRAAAPSLTTPVPVVTTPTGTSTGPVITLNGTARASAGGALEMFLYGVAGPSGDLGVAGNAQASLNSAGALSCSATLGPYASVGLNAAFSVLGFSWQHQLWKPALAPWLRWSGCGSTPPPPRPQLVVTPSSGIAGDRIAFGSSPRCPAVPAGYSQSVKIQFFNSAGVRYTETWSLPTAVDGSWGSPGQVTTAQFELMTDLSGRPYFAIPDMPTGTYSVHAQCEKLEMSGGTPLPTVTQVFAPGTYAVTGPSQRLVLNPSSVEPGDSFQISGARPCPAGTENVIVTDFNRQTGFATVPVDSAGNWHLTATLPTGAGGPYQAIQASCMASTPGEIRLDYGDAALTVTQHL